MLVQLQCKGSFAWVMCSDHLCSMHGCGLPDSAVVTAWRGTACSWGLGGAVPAAGWAPHQCQGSLGRQVRSLEAHMYPEKLKVIAQQVQLQQQQEQVRLLHQEKLEREQQIRTQVSADAVLAHPGCSPSMGTPQ